MYLSVRLNTLLMLFVVLLQVLSVFPYARSSDIILLTSCNLTPCVDTSLHSVMVQCRRSLELLMYICNCRILSVELFVCVFYLHDASTCQARFVLQVLSY